MQHLKTISALGITHYIFLCDTMTEYDRSIKVLRVNKCQLLNESINLNENGINGDGCRAIINAFGRKFAYIYLKPQKP